MIFACFFGEAAFLAAALLHNFFHDHVGGLFHRCLRSILAEPLADAHLKTNLDGAHVAVDFGNAFRSAFFNDGLGFNAEFFSQLVNFMNFNTQRVLQ